MILKFVARHPGLPKKDLEERIRRASGENPEQVGHYLNGLHEKYRLIERKQPLFALSGGRKGRYCLTDNFLQAWLAALANQVAARQFRPVDKLVEESDARLCDVEVHALEKLVATLYEERSRKGLPGFSLTRRIDGYWDRAGIELDLVAVDEERGVLRFGACKRNAGKLLADVNNFNGHVERFLVAEPAYAGWTVERVGVAPRLDDDQRAVLHRHDVLAQDLRDLTQGL